MDASETPTSAAHLIDGKYGIQDLVDIEQLKLLFDQFTAATGLTIGFLDHPGMNVLIATGWKDICTRFHRCTGASADNCAKSNQSLLDKLDVSGAAVIETCDNGLVDCAVPVIIAGKHVASLATGQMLLQPPDVEHFRAQARKFGYDEEAYLKALSDVQVVNDDKVRFATNFLGRMAEMISQNAYTRLKLEQEIAERERAEAALRQLSQAVEQSPASVVITDLDANIQYVNPHFCEVTGYTAAEAIGQNPRILQSRLTPHETHTAMWAALTSGQPWQGELSNRRKNGELYYEESHIAPVKDSRGVVTHYVAVKTEITERKAMEAQLLDSQNRYRFLFENSPLPMLVFAEDDQRFLEVSDSAVKHYGYSREEFGRMTLRDIRPAEDIPLMHKTLAETRGQKFSCERRHCKKDGTAIDVLLSVVPMDYGTIAARMAMVEDITERKQAEAALQRESEKNRLIIRNASDGLHVLDLNGTLIEASDSFCAMLGYDRTEVNGMHVQRWDADFDPASLTDVIREQYRSGERTQFETRHRRKDGSIFDVEVSGYPLELNSAPVMFYSSRDVSQRNAAERALRESEERLRLAMSVTDQGWFDVDLPTGRVEVSPEYPRMLGYEPEEFCSDLDNWMGNVHPEDSKNLIQTFRDCIETGGPREMEYRRRTKSGEWKWLRSIGKIVKRDCSGRALRMLGIHADISARKVTEAELENHRLNLEHLVENRTAEL